MKLKILQLIPLISEGGAETLVKDYVLQLNKEKYEVSVLTSMISSANSPTLTTILSKGIKVFSPYPFFNGHELIIYNKIIKRIYRLLERYGLKKNDSEKTAEYVISTIRKIRPDVIHVHMQMLKYLAPIASELKETKIFYTCHSLPQRYFNDTNEAEELKAAKSLITTNNITFIALHREMKMQLDKILGINDTIVLENCVNIEKFRNEKVDKRTIRKELGIDEDAFVIGCVGRLVYIKNQSFLIDILCECLKLNPKVYLLLVGAGPDFNSINEKICVLNLESHCKVIPPRGDIHRVLKALDVFVLPSLFEGLPLVAIEAQASGLRTVISTGVPKDVMFSERAVQCSLDLPASEWARIILDETIIGKEHYDIEEYSTERVMKKLESLYDKRM